MYIHRYICVVYYTVCIIIILYLFLDYVAGRLRALTVFRRVRRRYSNVLQYHYNLILPLYIIVPVR